MKRTKEQTNSQKRKLIKDHLKTAWSQSDRSVGRTLNVSHSTVASVRVDMINSGRFSHLSTDTEEWRNHQYLQGKQDLLETLNLRNLRAIKKLDVLDYLMANPSIKSPAVAQARLAKQRIEERKSASVTITKADIDIREADCTKTMSWIKPSSVGLCLCDPPWDSTSANVCKGILKNSARILKEGGSLLVLTGSSHLPEVLSALCANKALKYHWLLICPLPKGAPTSTSWFKVQSHVRVILWFVKGKYAGDIISDYIEQPESSNDADKAYHHWGQAEDIFATLIERFSDPGDTVCDMCVGGGSSAVAAVKLNRRFVGCDNEKNAVETTKRRVAQLFGLTKWYD